MRSVLLALVFGLLPTTARSDAAPASDVPLVRLAQGWLQALPPAKRAKANLPWNDANRRHWGYRPFTRRGLALREMSTSERQSLDAVWRAALSARGHADVQAVIARERILYRQVGARQRAAGWRDPGLYWMAIFGWPSADADAKWGWRLGGHHLSINLTYRGARLISATPWFVGGSPARTAAGHVTPEAETLARSLFASLPPAQQRTATWARLPGDIDMQRGRAVLSPTGRWGITGAQLPAPQQEQLRKLVRAFAAGVHPFGPRTEAVDAVRFAWRGRGADQYYRVVGPDFALEYRNIGNHVHAVWRHPTMDFGGP